MSAGSKKTEFHHGTAQHKTTCASQKQQQSGQSQTHLDAWHGVSVTEDVTVDPVQRTLAPLVVHIKALQVFSSTKSPIANEQVSGMDHSGTPGTSALMNQACWCKLATLSLV